jgi:predicted metal-dependent peptidase
MAEATIESEVIEFILQRKLFYGYFLQQFKRHITRDVKTLAVNITEDLKPNLYINPDFYNSLTTEEKMAVLEHELLHIMHKHLMRIEGRNGYVWNLACDVAINQFLKGLPFGALCTDCNILIHKPDAKTFPKECPKCHKKLDPNVDKCEPLLTDNMIINGKKSSLPKEKRAEIYYDILWKDIPKIAIRIGTSMTQSCEQCKKDRMGGGNGNGNGKEKGQQGQAGQDGSGSGQDKQGESNGGGGQFDCGKCKKGGGGHGIIDIDGQQVPVGLDDHDAWGAGSDNHEMTHEKIKDMVQKAVNKMHEKNQGTLPAYLQSLIDECLAHKTLTWKAILRRFVGYEEFADWLPSRKRLNKRFPMMMGSVVKMKAHIMVVVDTSGSISDEELSIFFTEIGAMFSAGVVVTVVQCDADIQDVKEYKQKKQKYECKGRGGTSFKPPFELAKNKTYKNCKGQVFTMRKTIDGIIYLTDGYGDYPKEVKHKTLWVFTPNHHLYGWNEKLGEKVVLEMPKQRN